MSSVFTAEEFSEAITGDRNWRLKEISNLKTTIVRSDHVSKRVLLRAMVTLCYAHWEGHVKYSANLYFKLIARRKHLFSDLSAQFLKNHFIHRLGAASRSNIGVKARCELVDEILSAENSRFKRINEELVNTKSNLNSDVLSEICIVCDVDYSMFESDAVFIDKMLLKRRNEIAHGEEVFVEESDLNSISSKTIQLMRSFSDQLDNAVQLETYKSR